jgi:hypothetical protein
MVKPPRKVFWAWTDIGDGYDWYLCAIVKEDDKPMIKYLTEDFEDFWYDEDWDETDVKLCEKPKRQSE